MQAFERELTAQVSGKMPRSDARPPGLGHRQPYSRGRDRRHGHSHHRHHKTGPKLPSRPSHHHHHHSHHDGGKGIVDYNSL